MRHNSTNQICKFGCIFCLPFCNAVGRHVQCNRRTTRPFETSASQMMDEVENGQGDHDEVESDIVAKPDRGASRSLGKVVKKVDVRRCVTLNTLRWSSCPVDPKIDKRSASFVPTNTRRKMHWATTVFDKESCLLFSFPSRSINSPTFLSFHICVKFSSSCQTSKVVWLTR